MGKQQDSRKMGKAGKKGSHRERQNKRKLLAQNFQKVGILFIPKEPSGIPTGERGRVYGVMVRLHGP